ncbi:hypothetical protein LEP1GSC040_3763 [Leptospira santarosai str. 2000030832]|nr:hypothetical protein LEP1GSC040_3763 [Leptospira santarosai str. 2000030832]
MGRVWKLSETLSYGSRFRFLWYSFYASKLKFLKKERYRPTETDDRPTYPDDRICLKVRRES